MTEGLRQIGHSDLGGHGDGMQIMRHGPALYVGHLGDTGICTTVLDVTDVASPRVVRQIPAPAGSHSHKVQVADGLLLVNQEQFRGGTPFAAGMVVYSLDDPFEPRQIGFFSSGGQGVHRIVWTGGRYAYMSAIPDGFDDRIWVIVDMSDPLKPDEVGRWWWPGSWRGGGGEPAWPRDKRYAAHHALLDDHVAYLGYGDAGMVVLDVSDIAMPRVVSTVNWEPGGDTHTCMPLPNRHLVVTTDEAIKERCAEDPKLVHVLDVSDPKSPSVVGACPQPRGDFCEHGLRFGPHNLHENRPGTYVSEAIIFVTYFNAGLRVYDIARPDEPQEIAHWLPETPAGQEAPQINDLYVQDDGLIFVTDRIHGGLYVLEPDESLARQMEAARA